MLVWPLRLHKGDLSLRVAKRIRDCETTIKIKFALLGGSGVGVGRRIVPKNAVFLGKRHDNKILKVQILLSRNFVVMAQAPRGV